MYCHCEQAGGLHGNLIAHSIVFLTKCHEIATLPSVGRDDDFFPEKKPFDKDSVKGIIDRWRNDYAKS